MTESILKDLFFILYLCLPFLNLIFQKITSYFGNMQVGKYIAIAIAYSPLILLFLFYLAKGKGIKAFIPDFWILLLCISLFFGITYLLHPEYKYWYERDVFGVMPYVLRPDNGLFIYLAIRLVNDPDRIQKDVRISGWIMFVFFARQLLQALLRGYWPDTSNTGSEIKMSYSLSFGYDVLLFALMFLFAALNDHKKTDIAAACISIAMILLGGSRGPILDIGIFVVLYVYSRIMDSPKKYKIITLIVIGGSILMMTYKRILLFAAVTLDKMGISSRFITMMVEGDVSNDNGREEIWNTAIGMIRQKPLGWGAMGTRHVIGNIIFVGHPHQVFLELLVDFGVIFGSALILLLIIGSARIILNKDLGKWHGIYIVFFARACQLLMSLTFWHSIGLWSLLAIGVCISNAKSERWKNKWLKVGLRM